MLNTSLISSRKWDFRLPAAASISNYPHIDVDCPESELRAHGITFTRIADSCVVRMAVRNGTAAKLLLPSGLITSFKAQMWHGGTMELLHTLVSAREANTGATAGVGDVALIQGGLSLALACQNGETDFSWSPDVWTLHQVTGTPKESIQVELIGKSEQAVGNVNHEVKHIISLEKDLLTSEVVVHNSSNSPLTLRGSALCHLGVSTPEATYAVGLEGSDFFIRPPLVSNFSIIPPDPQDPWRLIWPFDELFSKRNAKNSSAKDNADGLEGEEEDNYKHLTEKLIRIYTNAPRALTIMDRGKRNSVTMRRKGFEEVYIFSPGSEHESYNKYSYVCVGHAALLQPIMLNAQSEWRGSLQLLNPNS